MALNPSGVNNSKLRLSLESGQKPSFTSLLFLSALGVVSPSNDLDTGYKSHQCLSVQSWKLGWLRTTHCLSADLWDLISSPSSPSFCPSLLSLSRSLSHAPLSPQFILISNVNTCSFYLLLMAMSQCFFLIRSSRLPCTEGSCKATIQPSVLWDFTEMDHSWRTENPWVKNA